MTTMFWKPQDPTWRQPRHQNLTSAPSPLSLKLSFFLKLAPPLHQNLNCPLPSSWRGGNNLNLNLLDNDSQVGDIYLLDWEGILSICLFGGNSQVMIMKSSAELDGHLVSSEGDLDEDAAKIRLIEILTKMHQILDVKGFWVFYNHRKMG